MRGNLTTADRVTLLLSLVAFLRGHGPITISELSERFEVEPQELRRLARFLGTAGVPGETLTYQPEDLFDIDWTLLEEDDTLHLISTVAVEETPRFASVEAAALQAGLLALTQVLPEDRAVVAVSAAKKLAVTEQASTVQHAVTVSVDPTSETLEVIGEAIHSGVAVSFTYLNRNGEASQRRVEPHSLVERQGEWYLSGYCHMREAIREFRVDALSELVIHDESPIAPDKIVPPSDKFDPASLGKIDAIFHVRDEALYLTDPWNPTVLETADDGWTAVQVQLASEARAIDFVLLAPRAIIAVSPESVRGRVREWVASMLAPESEGDRPDEG